MALFLFSSVTLFSLTNSRSRSTSTSKSKIAAAEERKWWRGWRNKMKEEIWTICPPIHPNRLSHEVFIDASLIKRHFPSKKLDLLQNLPAPFCRCHFPVLHRHFLYFIILGHSMTLEATFGLLTNPLQPTMTQWVTTGFLIALEMTTDPTCRLLRFCPDELAARRFAFLHLPPFGQDKKNSPCLK